MATPTYSVTLHHLSPGAKAAGLAYPDEQLPTVSLAQLRELLYSLSEVAARLTIYEPSAPEIRIKTDREIFTVRTRYRRLCFVGWEAILRGEDHSVGYILTTITGSTEPVKAGTKNERPSSTSPTTLRPASSGTTASPFATTSPPMRKEGMPRWAKVAALSILIVGANSVTAWMLLRPPSNLIPKYDLLSPPESRALLIKTAGEYETGAQEGDRRLVVKSDGTLRLGKFGPQRSVVEEHKRSCRGAMVAGRAALITNDPAVLEIKDADTLTLYGNTYRRHVP